MPGVDVGISAEDPTIAECLKPLGYATGQFGKNHLGDLNKYLPTVHGFDEFFGNLYPPERRGRARAPGLPDRGRGPEASQGVLTARGVIHSWATDEDTGEVDERYGPVGKQRIQDTGPHANSWPDGATTPFRSEKNTNWEGAFRIPEMIRWPGKIPAGVVSNEIIQHHDWFPTFLAAGGEPNIIEKLKNGHKVSLRGEEKEFKVHLDAFNLLPYLTGEVGTSPRRGMIYFSDDCDVLGIRVDNWKVVFMEQRRRGTLQI